MSNRKHLRGAFLAALLCCTLAAAPTMGTTLRCFAEEGTDSVTDGNTQSLDGMGAYIGDGYTLSYEKTDGGVMITQCTGEAETISLPDRFSDTEIVVEIAEGAFYQYTTLKSVKMGNAVKKIGQGAFYGCTALTDVTLSTSLTTIGMQAFSGCTALGAIALPDSLTTIEASVFSNCTSLTDLTIPAAATLGEHVFDGCTALTEIRLAAGNSSYATEDGILYNKDKTTLLQYPAGKPQTSFTPPASVTEIAASGFYSAAKLQTVSIPAAVAKIGDYAFEGCTALAAINVDAANEAYTSADGVLFDKTKNTLLKFPDASTLTEYTVPDETTSLANWCFVGAKQLTRVDLNKVTTIGEDAFYSCEGLEEIKIPRGVTALNGACFAFCKSLSRVSLPETLTSISGYCFVSCTALKSISVPGSVATIGDYALGYQYDPETGEATKMDDFTMDVSVGSAAKSYAEKNEIAYTKSGATLAIIIGICIGVLAIAIVVVAWISHKRAMIVRPAKNMKPKASRPTAAEPEEKDEEQEHE